MVEKKVITLKFDDLSLPSLSGDPDGERAFNTQVKPKLDESDYENGIIIKFPDYISIIGASFMQGFSRFFVQKIGYDGIKERIEFQTSSKELTQEVYDDIY
ncbi:hypothetical protein [Leuconostoc mesenteroides]|uniref:hypothetical protein n=1 Tax=Leuconostoc mesenteroides TaxID=1245 RepID=UPI002362CB8D|nr:hypothetical protein [Leuconostoc mesenteroides]